MSKDITPSCSRSGTVPDCSVQGHVLSKYQYIIYWENLFNVNFMLGLYMKPKLKIQGRNRVEIGSKWSKWSKCSK